MSTDTGTSRLMPPSTADDKVSAEPGSSSSENSHTHLTPESDSDEDGELGFNEPGESYELHGRIAVVKEGGDGNGKDDEDTYLDSEEDEDEDEPGTYRRPGRRRVSMSTVQSFQLYTPDEERAVVKKLDRRLVLFVAFLYMLSFLDRSNIGNARIAGLERDLHLDSSKFEWLLQAFYFAYIAFEWFSVLWRLVPAHIYITIIVLSWGVIASLQSIATSFYGLLILRIFLGIGEAGFAGIPIYLSFFFKREELALRTGYFISAAPLATSFASSLAWAIIKLGTKIPIASWRLLFLVEGFPAILVAVLAFRIIPDSPSTTSYFTSRERKVARLRLRKQVTPSTSKENTSSQVRDLLATLSDPKNYFTALMLFCTNMSLASMPVFLPTIIQSMGHTAAISQALSAPPYLLSFFIVLLTAHLSDRFRSRSTFIIFHSLLSCLGYLFVAGAGYYNLNHWFRYAGIFPAAVGFFSVITIVITWMINNQESEGKKGWGFAMLQVVGQCGPLVGTRLYPRSDGPLYLRGLVGCSGAMLGTAVLAGLLRWYLSRRNRVVELEYGRVGEEEGMELVGKETGEGRQEPFRYML